jgi:hypothetical protein
MRQRRVGQTYPDVAEEESLVGCWVNSWALN